MNQHVPRILVVGAVTADFTQRWDFNLSADPDLDKKKDLLDSDFTLGGGAGNCAVALKLLDEAFQTYSHVELDTRIGRPPQGDLVAEIAALVIDRRLAEHGIRPKDITSGESHNALNGVSNHGGGRLIGRDPRVTTGDLEPGYQNTIANDVHGSDVVFVDPKKRRMGVAAVLSAKEHGKHCILDWGQDSWPDNHEEAAACDTMLRNASIVVVPDDAIVAGMKEKDPNLLFTKLRDYYGIDNILMSNGGKPVRYLIDGASGDIDVYPPERLLDTNAAGDTRNAGIVWALARGFSIRNAFVFGTALASIKIQYNGLEWAEHVVEHISKDEHSKHLVTLIRATERMQSQQSPDQAYTHG